MTEVTKAIKVTGVTRVTRATEGQTGIRGENVKGMISRDGSTVQSFVENGFVERSE